MLISDFMSSEESDDESEDIIVVKPLVWRSERVTRFLQQLDEKCKDTKTTQAKRQRNFARKKSSYPVYCTGIPQGRGLVKLSCLWAWPEMTSQ